MNEIIQNMVSRRSVRAFKPDMPPKETIDEIIKAGTYAPTGRGMQSPIIVAVTNKQVRDRLSQINAKIMGHSEDFDPFYNAPVVLIVLADKTKPTYLYDGSLVMGNLMLSAHSLGVGSCWIHRAKETFETLEGKELLKNLGITGDYEGIGNCVLGYPVEPLKDAPPRKENYVYYIN
jgi:nitroreductase